MIKYLCDAYNCGKDADYPNGESWTDQEMFDIRDVAELPYFWFRVGIAGKTFCPEHKKSAMQGLVKLISEKYK